MTHLPSKFLYVLCLKKTSPNFVPPSMRILLFSMNRKGRGEGHLGHCNSKDSELNRVLRCQVLILRI